MKSKKVLLAIGQAKPLTQQQANFIINIIITS